MHPQGPLALMSVQILSLLRVRHPEKRLCASLIINVHLKRLNIIPSFLTDLWPPLGSLVQNIFSSGWVCPIVSTGQGQVKGTQPRLDSFVTGSNNKADFSRDGVNFMGLEHNLWHGVPTAAPTRTDGLPPLGISEQRTGELPKNNKKKVSSCQHIFWVLKLFAGCFLTV